MAAAVFPELSRADGRAKALQEENAKRYAKHLRHKVRETNDRLARLEEAFDAIESIQLEGVYLVKSGAAADMPQRGPAGHAFQV